MDIPADPMLRLPCLLTPYRTGGPIGCGFRQHKRCFPNSEAPMSFDLLVKNATLPDGRAGQDIAVSNGRIAAVGRDIAAEAGRVIDAAGRLVTPPFVDCHFHMDATLSLGIPRLNRSGTLLEGIQLWNELKPQLTH